MYSTTGVVSLLLLFLKGSFAIEIAPDEVQTSSPDGPEYSVVVEKSLPGNPLSEKESMHQDLTNSYNKTTEEITSGVQTKSTSNNNTHTTENESKYTTRKNNQLGPVENTTITQNNVTNTDDALSQKSNSQLLNSELSVNTTSSVNTSNKGTKTVRSRPQGEIIVGDSQQREGQVKHTVVHNNVTAHPQPNHETKFIFDKSHQEINEKVVTSEFFDETLDNINFGETNGTINTSHTSKSKKQMKLHHNSSKERKEITKNTDITENQRTTVKKEKTIIKRKTPLSDLLITDQNLEKTDENFTKQTTDVTRKNDDKKGTTSTTHEKTEKDMRQQRTTHSNQFTFDKTPTENSKSLPIKISLTAEAVDSDHYRTHQNTQKTVDTKTPTSTVRERFTTNTVKEYSFDATPQQPEKQKNKCRNKSLNKTQIANLQVANEVDSFSLEVTHTVDQNDENNCEPETEQDESEATTTWPNGEQKNKTNESKQVGGTVVEIDVQQSTLDSESTEEQRNENEETDITVNGSGEKITTAKDNEEKITLANESEKTLVASNESDPPPAASNESKKTLKDDKTTDETADDFGTIILVLPTPKQQNGDVVSFMKRMVDSKITELIKIAKSYNVSRFMLAGPVDEVAVDDVDSLLHKYTENHPIAVLNVDLKEGNAEVYELHTETTTNDSDNTM